MTKELQTNEWYEALLEDLRATIIEAEFNSRWALVEGHSIMGKLITEASLEQNLPITKLLQNLAVDSGISERKLWYSVQLYKKYPDLGKIPEGKNISMNKLITQYLPEPKKEKTPKLPEGKFDVIYADPPWCYGDKHDYNGTTGAETYYPSL